MTTFDHETIIVGAGAAGMNCALDLQKANHDYLLIADYMGGRILNDTGRHMNYGAVFYFGSYRTMLSKERGILKPTTDVVPSLTAAACNPDDSRQWGALSAKTASDLPSLWRFESFMVNEFLPHYEQFKKDCEIMEVREALAKDPFIDQLFHETAAQMIDRLNIKPIADDLVSMFAHACTGTPPAELMALDYLNTVQPLSMRLPSMQLVMSLTRFDFDTDEMTGRLGRGSGEVLLGNLVTTVEKIQGGWKVTTDEEAAFTAENLVMATPADVTERLLEPVEEVPAFKARKACTLYAYLLKGKIREHYAHHAVHIFSEKTPIIFISTMPGEDMYEIFTEVDFEEGNRMEKYFERYEIQGRKAWPRAMFTGPTEALPQNLAPGLIMAGDHNGLGMEPAAISGIYAANKVLGKTVDEKPDAYAAAPSIPYASPAGPKGAEETLQAYGAVLADCGQQVVSAAKNNKVATAAAAAGAAAVVAAAALSKRK
ncbi:NAD(P)/FAD-dependent oxidoreductase [Curtanaerobium respiraculi]|uniref:NAD(P)/FAD-dependent oxidoreductase n=1 Tax=Curtanaerobium respiraculi TaxID=2949669 RepID=UPI0024B37E0D|nr:NAD(P)/FAD-dependent oxidoreductase [Curtanaerobium respiraculi]